MVKIPLGLALRRALYLTEERERGVSNMVKIPLGLALRRALYPREGGEREGLVTWSK
jgi:hypothetical protein